MKLQEKMDKYKEQMQVQAPKEALHIMHSATKDAGRKVYSQFGIDVPAHNGDDSWTLPLSARFIIDQGGIIRYSEINTDYTVRSDPEHTLEKLKLLKT